MGIFSNLILNSFLTRNAVRSAEKKTAPNPFLTPKEPTISATPQPSPLNTMSSSTKSSTPQAYMPQTSFTPPVQPVAQPVAKPQQSFAGQTIGPRTDDSVSVEKTQYEQAKSKLFESIKLPAITGNPFITTATNAYNMAKTGIAAYQVQKAKPLPDIEKREDDRLSYLRTKEFEKTLAETKVVIPKDYKEPDTFKGQLWEGVKSGVLSATAVPGYVAEVVGKDIGSPDMIKWGQKFGDQQSAKYVLRTDLSRPKDMKPFLEGGFSDPRLYARYIGETVPSITAMLTSSVIGGAVAGPSGAIVGSYGSIYALEQANSYKSMIDNGVAPDKAGKASQVYGGIAAVLENVFGYKPAKIAGQFFTQTAKDTVKKSFLDYTLKKLPKLPFRILKNTVEEGAEESLQQLTQNLISGYLEDNTKVFDDVAESFFAGSIGSLPFGVSEIVSPQGRKEVEQANTFLKSKVGLSIQDITEEAKKYDTVDKFIKALDINYEDSWVKGDKDVDADRLKKVVEGVYFHGTDSVKQIKANGFRVGNYFNSGIYFAKTPEVSIDYMNQERSKGGDKGVFAISFDNLKIKDISNSDFREMNKGYEMEDDIAKFKKQKYDGVRSEVGETLVWNVKKLESLKTLADIYGEAHGETAAKVTNVVEKAIDNLTKGKYEKGEMAKIIEEATGVTDFELATPARLPGNRQGDYGGFLIRLLDHNGKLSEFTGHHEGWHMMRDTFLELGEIKRLENYVIKNYKSRVLAKIKLYKKEGKTLTQREAAEEVMADEWATYVTTGKTTIGKLISTFKRLYQKMAGVFGKRKKLLEYFSETKGVKKVQLRKPSKTRRFSVPTEFFDDRFNKLTPGQKSLYKNKLAKLRRGGMSYEEAKVKAVERAEQEPVRAKKSPLQPVKAKKGAITPVTKKEIEPEQYSPEEIKALQQAFGIDETGQEFQGQMETNYERFVDLYEQIKSKPGFLGLRETIDGGDVDTFKKIAKDRTTWTKNEDIFGSEDMNDSEVFEEFRSRLLSERPELVLGKKVALEAGLTGKPPSKVERSIVDKFVNTLDPDIKEMAEPYFRPPRFTNSRAFALLGNKDTTVPLFSSIFSRWAANGIDTIIEPYGGAFTLGAHSIKDAMANGLKSYNANIYDLEKHTIVSAIQAGKLEEVQEMLKQAAQNLNGRILDLSREANNGSYEVFTVFLDANPGSYIGSNAWKNYIRGVKMGKDVTVFKEDFNRFKVIFDKAVADMSKIEPNDLGSSIDRAFIDKVQMRGNELISRQSGFQAFEDKVFGKYGMATGFQDIADTFEVARENGVTVDIGKGGEDGWDFVNRIAVTDPKKVGYYFDPPYVLSSATYKGGQATGDFLGEHFGNPDNFVRDHQKAFDNIAKGSEVVLTNDVENGYIKRVMEEVDNDSFQVYREGLTPTSLISSRDTTGIITDFFASSYNKKAKEIWSDMEQLSEVIKRGGYTEKTFKRLKDHGVTDDIIELLKVDDKYFKNLIKIKVEPNGEVSATISKEALAYIDRTSKIPELSKKWINKQSLSYYKKIVGDTFQGYETGARFFLRLGEGYKNLMFDPIIAGERLAAIRANNIRDVKLKTTFNLSKKEARQLFAFTASKQGVDIKAPTLEELPANVRKAYNEIRSLVKELYPEVRAVAAKNGKDLGEIKNYSPLYTQENLELLDGGGFDFTRKDPFFSSLKERTEDVPAEMYEQDYRKVMDAWADGVSRYIDVGSRTLPVKYLIDSLEVQELAGRDVHKKLVEWYKNIVSPQRPEGVMKGLRVFRRLNAMGILAIKYTVILKQFLNVVDFWALSNSSKIIKGTSKVLGDSPIARSAALSGSVQQRALGYAVNDLRGSIIEWMRKPSEYTDKLTSKIGKVVIMDQMIARVHASGKRLNPKEFKRIQRISDDIIDAVMGSMSKADMPRYFRTEGGKAINMFYSQLNSKMQFYVTDIFKDPKYANISGSKKKLLAKALVAVILGGFMEQLINKLYFDDDPEEISKDILKSIIGNFPLLGSFLFAIETGQPYSPSPILGNVMALIKSISRGDAEGAMWDAAGFVGMAKQIENLIRGGYVVIDGGVRDKNGKFLFYVNSLPEQTRTLLKGKWGSKAGQEYFDKGSTRNNGSNPFLGK